MYNPFRLKQPIGEAFNMDLDDSLKTKKALAALGHLEIPDHGLTEFPDQPMLDGVRSFQRDQGLKQDGVMKPDGPTIKRLNAVMAAKQQESAPATAPKPRPLLRPDQPAKAKPYPPIQPITLNRPITPATNVDLGDTGRVKSALHHLGLLDTRGLGLDEFPDAPLFKGIKAFQRENGLRVDGEMKPEGETVGRLNEVMAANLENQPAAVDPASSKPEGIQVAQTISLEDLLWMGALGGGALWAQQAGERLQKNDKKPGTSQRTDIAPPTPPLPGFEPPDLILPDPTESPPQPVELLDLSQPIPDIEKPSIFVFPSVESGEFGDGIVERKGNEATRKELERFRDYFRRKGWVHIAGGRFAADDPMIRVGAKDAKAGGERPEFHVKGHFGGLKGGRFTDLTFEDENGRIIHVQSVDVDKYGKPTQRELDAAEAIRRATGHSVLLIPKGAQLDRLEKRHRRR